MHRNIFIQSKELLNFFKQFKKSEDLFFAGQIKGTDRCLGRIAFGLVAGINASKALNRQLLISFPEDTIIGALCYYITDSRNINFQPMTTKYFLLPLFEKPIRNKNERGKAYYLRSMQSLHHHANE